MAILGTHDTALDALRQAYKIPIEEARLFVLSQPITTWLPQIRSVEELEECANLARSYTPLNERELELLLEKTAIYGGSTLEFYKQ
jgi:predicted aldo/keto reductase-like oxidoreductase